LTLACSLALLAAAMTSVLDVSGLAGPLQLKAFDALFYLRQKSGLHRGGGESPIVLLGIDDQTFDDPAFKIPKVLWHEHFAVVIKGLADGGARVIGLDFLLPQADFDHIAPNYSRTWLTAFQYAKSKGAPVVTGIVQTANRTMTPEEKYLQIIGGERIGLFNLTTDHDDFIRRQRLVFPTNQPGRAVYAVPLLVARAYNPDLKFPGESIYIDYSSPAGLKRLSFAEVYHKAAQGDVAYLRARFQGKIVMIGETDILTQDRHPTPMYYTVSSNELRRTPGVDILCHTVATLLEGRLFKEVGDLRFVLYCLLAGLCASAAMWGSERSFLIVLPLVLGGWLIASFVAFVWYIVPPVIGGMLAWFFGSALALSFRYWQAERAKREAEADSAEVNRMLAVNFQSQGLLDLAFDYFRKVPASGGLEDALFNLGLDYERKRQFRKAIEVYQHIRKEVRADYRDLEDRIKRLGQIADSVIIGLGTRGVQSIDVSLMIDENTRPKLGRYEIYKELGRGGMGVVYLGRDPKIGRAVAIKTIGFAREHDENEAQTLKEQFFNEARTAGRLTHPHIVTIYEADEDNDLAYIAMEYLDGYDLRTHTEPENRLPGRQVIGLVADIAEALHYAHENGVVHRDIKPANLMLLNNGSVKITDFGIARATASSGTRTGLIKGTPFYMSPEQIIGRHVDGRSDVFSLGVVLYQLLTGVLPFRSDDLTVLIYKITAGDLEPVTVHNPKVPRVVDHIIRKSLAKGVDNRYRTAGQMETHLRMVCRKIDERMGR